jgi:hypothetical protein
MEFSSEASKTWDVMEEQHCTTTTKKMPPDFNTYHLEIEDFKSHRTARLEEVAVQMVQENGKRKKETEKLNSPLYISLSRREPTYTNKHSIWSNQEYPTFEALTGLTSGT